MIRSFYYLFTHLTQTEVWTIVANRGSDQKWEAPREAKSRLGL